MREARSVGPPVRDSNPKSPVNTFRRFFKCATSEKRVRNDMVITTTRAPHARRGTSHVNFSLVPVRSNLFLFSTCTAHAAFPRRRPRAATREDAGTTRRNSLDTFRRFGNRSRFARFARAMPPVEDAAVSFVADRRASYRAREETRRPTNAFPPTPPDTDPFRSDPRDASRNISTQPS